MRWSLNIGGGGCWVGGVGSRAGAQSNALVWVRGRPDLQCGPLISGCWSSLAAAAGITWAAVAAAGWCCHRHAPCCHAAEATQHHKSAVSRAGRGGGAGAGGAGGGGGGGAGGGGGGGGGGSCSDHLARPKLFAKRLDHRALELAGVRRRKDARPTAALRRHRHRGAVEFSTSTPLGRTAGLMC